MEPPKWRLIVTDTETLSGVAPVCPEQRQALHTFSDNGNSFVDDHGVYDCCPHPHIECWSEGDARLVARLLNLVGAEPCS